MRDYWIDISKQLKILKGKQKLRRMLRDAAVDIRFFGERALSE